MKQVAMLVLGMCLAACAPEPLGFAADDGGALPDALADAFAGDEAVAEASTAPIVYLLVRDTADSTVDALRSELQAFGIPHLELTPSAAKNLPSVAAAVFVAGFSSEPSEWAYAAPAIVEAVSAGSWILLEGFALYLLDYGAVEAIKTTQWTPSCKDGFYFVAPVAPEVASLFDGIPSWDPPQAPDNPAQSILEVVSLGLHIGAELQAESAAWTALPFWELVTSYGCPGLSTASSFCSSWGSCTPSRTVLLEQSFMTRKLANGRIDHFTGTPPVPGLTAWGPALALLHRNVIQWGIAEVSKL